MCVRRSRSHPPIVKYVVITSYWTQLPITPEWSCGVTSFSSSSLETMHAAVFCWKNWLKTVPMSLSMLQRNLTYSSTGQNFLRSASNSDLCTVLPEHVHCGKTLPCRTWSVLWWTGIGGNVIISEIWLIVLIHCCSPQSLLFRIRYFTPFCGDIWLECRHTACKRLVYE